MKYCKDEMREKGYSIKTAARSIVDLNAKIQDSSATIEATGDEISKLGTQIADQEK